MDVPSQHNGEFVVDPAIRSTSFACDLVACRGACCTLPGGRGAPLLDEEVEQIYKAALVVEDMLSKEHAEVLRTTGPVEGDPNDRHTTCVDMRACVFVVYDGPIARCSIEQAYLRGEIPWRKPLSCHLYPIRVDPGKPPRLRYDSIPECRPALERGAVENIPLATFVQPALERLLGTHLNDALPRLLP